MIGKCAGNWLVGRLALLTPKRKQVQFRVQGCCKGLELGEGACPRGWMGGWWVVCVGGGCMSEHLERPGGQWLAESRVAWDVNP